MDALEIKMNPKIVMQLERDLKLEQMEIDNINHNIGYIRERLLERVPNRFSTTDIINAFFGSLILGLTFILKGQTIQTATGLSWSHIAAIVIVTLAILVAEIYFIGYTKVVNKNQRKLFQFIAKRLVALYLVTIIVSISLVYLLNINNSPSVSSQADVLKIVTLTSFPCAIGAAVPSLLKKYV